LGTLKIITKVGISIWVESDKALSSRVARRARFAVERQEVVVAVAVRSLATRNILLGSMTRVTWVGQKYKAKSDKKKEI
jgi:hypothetical protein